MTADSAIGTLGLLSASNRTRRQSFAQTSPQIEHVRFLHAPPRQPTSHRRFGSRERGIRSSRRLIACAGLQSDRLARLAGLKIEHRIVPFRGEYHVLPPRLSNIVKHLIYPIPDPDLPFLGIHLTRMIDGSVTVGPNAVLGFDREGYPKGMMKAADIADS